MPQLRNPRHEIFAQECLTARTYRDAYINMGGKAADATRASQKLIQRPEIRERVDELLAERKERIFYESAVTKERVVQGLLKNIAEASKGAPIFKDGVVVGHRPAFQAVNQAWELLGLEHGMFVRRREEIDPTDNPLAGMDAAQLLGHIKRVFAKLGFDFDDAFFSRAIGIRSAASPGEDRSGDADVEAVGVPRLPETAALPQSRQ